MYFLQAYKMNLIFKKSLYRGKIIKIITFWRPLCHFGNLEKKLQKAHMPRYQTLLQS